MEEVRTSLPDVQSREENDANMQQKLNILTSSVCNKDATGKYYLVVNVTFKYIADARSYRHTNLTILLKSKVNTLLIARQIGLADLSSNGVDVLINDIREHLVEIKTINNLIREENQHLRGENIQNKNNLKVEKNDNTNNVKDLETKFKKMQTELSKANRKLAESIKEINRLQHQINRDTDINGKPNTIAVSIN